MINKIVNFQNSVNGFVSRKMLIPYSVSVGIQNITEMNYSVTPNEQNILIVTHTSDGALQTQNSMLTSHYDVTPIDDMDSIITRKNNAD